MTNLFNAMTTSDSLTENGAVTNSTSGSAVVNLFANMGAARGSDLTNQFVTAYSEDKDLTLRCMQYCRDPRGGMGERQHFRDWLKTLTLLDIELAERIMNKIPEIGRFDDLRVFMNTPLQNKALTIWLEAITVNQNGLAAKWAPRKGPVKEAMRKLLGVPPKVYRKLVVQTTDVVETKMCNRDWDKIEYSKLPSRAQMIYRKAFARNDSQRYQEYLDGLESGETKVNASTLYPYEVIKNVKGPDNKLAEAQWEALPDYVPEDLNFLPVVDVSGSMCAPAGNTGVNCLEAAAGLGMYLAERCKGKFKNEVITFSERPQIHKIQGSSLYQKLVGLHGMDWGFNTDIDAVFNLVLNSALMNRLPQEELPDTIVILSDMEFDYCGPKPAPGMIKDKYKKAGYTAPSLVFWNLRVTNSNMPAKFDEQGTMLVSGLSPAIMKSILSGEVITPLDMVKSAVCVPKYDY